MRLLRTSCLQALGRHLEAILFLKKRLEQGMDKNELQMERLMLALSAIDLDSLQVDMNRNGKFLKCNPNPIFNFR
jgi:hypothetical protein